MPHRAPSIDDLLAHGDFVRALARRLVADEATANDVVQDVWIRALQRPPRNSESLAGWVARVARNLVRDRAKSEQARGQREQAHGARRLPDESGPVAQRAASVEHLGRAFAALPPTYRDVLYLRYYEDRGPREIAELLDLSEATAKTRLRRGLELLRTDMKARLGGERSFALALVPFAAAHVKTGGLWMTKKAIAAGLIVLVGGGFWLARAVNTPLEVTGTSSSGPELETALEVAARPGEELDRAAAPEPEPLVPARTPLEAATADTPFAGRVSYRSTGQGVPFYRFSVRAAGSATEEYVETAKDGSFRTERAYGPEVVVLLPEAAFEQESYQVVTGGRDDRRAPETFVISASEPVSGGPDQPLARAELYEERALERTRDYEELVVELGPTYLLDFRPPPGYAHDDFDANIVGVKYQSLGRRRELMPVTAEPRPFVRFPVPGDEVYEEPWEWRFELLSHDGQWAGRAPTNWIEGVHRESVEIELVVHTNLAGTVTDTEGNPVGRVSVRLQEQGGERTHTRRTEDDGSYRFELLEPGAYAQYIQDDHYLPWKEVVALPGGETLNDAVLTARPAGGPVRGRITSATGTFDAMTWLFLEGSGDQNVWRRHDIEWQLDEHGASVGEFEFPDIGHGSYRLVCNTIEGVPIARRIRDVAPPAIDVHFHIEDDRPALDLDLRVTDASTGTTIEDFHFLSRVERGYMDDHRVTPEQALSRTFREGVFFEWWIRAEGFQPARGSVEDVGEDGRLTVRLEPGFAAIVHVLSIESLSSVAGVTVYADGVPVGVTDHEGDLVFGLPRAPKAIGFDPTKWTIYSDGGYHSDIDQETGAYDVGDRFHLAAYLRRVE